MDLIAVPLLDESQRIRISDVGCFLSLEHWTSARALLRLGLLPSASVVHRAQFEALARSIWLLYAASDDHLSKLTDYPSLESEQAAKNMPQTSEMIANAGIHPIRRHDDGYPFPLLQMVGESSCSLVASMATSQSIVGCRPRTSCWSWRSDISAKRDTPTTSSAIASARMPSTPPRSDSGR